MCTSNVVDDRGLEDFGLNASGLEPRGDIDRLRDHTRRRRSGRRGRGSGCGRRRGGRRGRRCGDPAEELDALRVEERAELREVGLDHVQHGGERAGLRELLLVVVLVVGVFVAGVGVAQRPQRR